MNREQWLTKALALCTEHLFNPQGYSMPDKVRVSVGFPRPKRGKSAGKAVGQAWRPEVSEDGTYEVFISPVLGDPVEALGTLVHEGVHCVVGIDAGHKQPFKRCATDVGLCGKMTATESTPGLVAYFEALVEGELGPYPHAGLNPKDVGGSKGSRLKKVVCPRCYDDRGHLYVVRMTKKWLESLGAPICPNCEQQMSLVE